MLGLVEGGEIQVAPLLSLSPFDAAATSPALGQQYNFQRRELFRAFAFRRGRGGEVEVESEVTCWVHNMDDPRRGAKPSHRIASRRIQSIRCRTHESRSQRQKPPTHACTRTYAIGIYIRVYAWMRTHGAHAFAGRAHARP